MTGGDALSPLEIPARREDVEWIELEGEAVLYDPSAHMLHRLNREAAAVWRSCDGSASTGQITCTLEEAYPASRETIATDVPAVIERLRRLSLLRPL
jgi:Coenzyme PQQ synthesis protein D (PqqD)